MRDPLLATRRRALTTSILSVIATSHDGYFSRQVLAAQIDKLGTQVANENASRFARTSKAVVRPFSFEGSQEWQLVASADIPVFTRVASYPVEVLSTDDGRVDGSSNYALAIYQDDQFGLSTTEFRGVRGIPTPRSMTRTYVDGLPAAGMYANEPTGGPNCVFEFPHTRGQPEAGDIASGFLMTTRPVRKGEALTWCYGDLFQRNYKTGCADPASIQRLSGLQ